MPLFEYRCVKCGHVTTFIEKPGVRGPHACEKCGSKNMEKLISTFSVQGDSRSSSTGSGCSTGTCPLG
ncbi:MAG TPA: zinc ribbon domain-containing protein [Phycisphaerales bacterium]|nr:zinc ribbon domain-containing protein [Phycisphaerales bacterium]